MCKCLNAFFLKCKLLDQRSDAINMTTVVSSWSLSPFMEIKVKESSGVFKKRDITCFNYIHKSPRFCTDRLCLVPLNVYQD